MFEALRQVFGHAAWPSKALMLYCALVGAWMALRAILEAFAWARQARILTAESAWATFGVRSRERPLLRTGAR